VTQVAGAAGTPDFAFKALFDQQGQVATVVEVGVREDDGVNVVGLHWQWRAVTQAQLFVALEQAAVDHELLTVVLHQKLGAGHRTGPAQKSDADVVHASISPHIA
jgi:hypothetical protein